MRRFRPPSRPIYATSITVWPSDTQNSPTTFGTGSGVPYAATDQRRRVRPLSFPSTPAETAFTTAVSLSGPVGPTSSRTLVHSVSNSFSYGMAFPP